MRTVLPLEPHRRPFHPDPFAGRTRQILQLQTDDLQRQPSGTEPFGRELELRDDRTMGTGHFGRGVSSALRPLREGDGEQDLAEQPQIPPAIQIKRRARQTEGLFGDRGEGLEEPDQERSGRHDRALLADQDRPQDRPLGHD